MPMNTQEILNIVLIICLLAVTGAIVATAYFFIKALNTVTTLAESLEETNQAVKDKIQMKALAVIPPLLIGIISKIFKKRG